MAAKLIGEAFISGAIQLLLERIASPEVVSYFLGRSDSDFEHLRKRLEAMVRSLTAVLDDAEQRQIRNDPRVEAWLDEVQEAVFDADDLLDEIETDALQRKVEGEPNAGTSEVRESKRLKMFNLFPSWSRSSNKGDVESKVTKILNRLEEIAKEKALLGLKEADVQVTQWQRSPSTSLVEESEVFGRDGDKEAVTKMLLSDDARSEKIGVIPIVGMGGVGKTTLAQAVFNHQKVRDHFDVKAWVCVSEEYEASKVTKTILKSVSQFPCDGFIDLNSLQVKLKECLARKRFLIVLDDVWNEKYVDWEVLRMPFSDGARGSKIIVTTRSEEVASIMGSQTDPAHRLSALTEEASWQLFTKHAFGDFAKNLELERIGRDIVKKCKGLPLAIKTLGGLLRSKLEIDQWEVILKSEMWELNDKQSDILPALRLSYHYLPSHLKRCFAYCSIFPKDYEFDKEELVLLWMAENLLEQPKGNKSMEEVGNQYFDHLLSWSFFQHSSTVYGPCFIMHDLIVDLANYVSGKYCFRLESKRSYEAMTKETRYIACIGNRDIISERFNSILDETRVRTLLLLNFHGNCQISKVVARDFFLKLRYLRVLSLYSHYECNVLTDSISELRHLRFLDLSGTSIENLPDFVCTLYNLQTLKLADCTQLSKLPNDFKNLINLRYLDASGTKLEELPESLSLMFMLEKLNFYRCWKLIKLPKDFHRLINLRYLNIEGSGLEEMPTHMSKLKSLQTLSTFVVGKETGAKISELGKLTNLIGTLRIKNLQNIVKLEEALEARLREKKLIEKLIFEWTSHETNDSIRELGLLENLMPHSTLQKLAINGFGGTEFPDWLGHRSFCNMVDVHLSNFNNCVSLPPLGQLASLKILHIAGFNAVVNVGPEFYGTSSSTVTPFASLEVLQFSKMLNWKKWLMPDGDVEAFPKLMKLILVKCNLTGDLCSLLPSLSELTISECPQLALSFLTMPKLTDLVLENCSENIIRSMEALESSRYLRNLNITGNLHSVFFRRLPTALKSLTILSYTSFEFKIQQQSYDSLEELSIRSYENASRLSLAMDNFPNTKSIFISGFQNLESLRASSNGISFDSLTSLSIVNIINCSNLTLLLSKLPNLTDLVIDTCQDLKFLPEQMHNLLPSLKSLRIGSCSELESFPVSGLPSSLSALQISNCDILVASRRNWGLQRLPNLTSFMIAECGGIELFPEEGLLPFSVTHLSIASIESLTCLNNKALQQLTSLKELFVNYCLRLQAMTEEVFPDSLVCLSIDGCPLIEEKCQRETGEYWNKISHIPSIMINLRPV